jgi:hypothetical protein
MWVDPYVVGPNIIDYFLHKDVRNGEIDLSAFRTRRAHRNGWILREGWGQKNEEEEEEEK